MYIADTINKTAVIVGLRDELLTDLRIYSINIDSLAVKVETVSRD